MYSMFKQERDPEGREVIELGIDTRILIGAAMIVPIAFMAMAYFTVGQGPMGLPWFMVAAPIAFAAIGGGMAFWMASRTKVRITVDRLAGKLLVATAGGLSEVRIADLANAEFAAKSLSEGGTVHRLEFVMKDGTRVPATSTYSNSYSPGNQAKTVAAINATLGQRMV